MGRKREGEGQEGREREGGGQEGREREGEGAGREREKRREGERDFKHS